MFRERAMMPHACGTAMGVVEGGREKGHDSVEVLAWRSDLVRVCGTRAQARAIRFRHR
jgi:hypothetical protein